MGNLGEMVNELLHELSVLPIKGVPYEALTNYMVFLIVALVVTIVFFLIAAASERKRLTGPDLKDVTSRRTATWMENQILHPDVLASQKCQTMPPFRFFISAGLIVLFVHPDACRFATVLPAASNDDFVAFLEGQQTFPLCPVSAL